MQTVAIARTDGGVSIMRVKDGRDVDAQVEEWKVTAPGEYVSHAVVGTLPTDRSNRGRWSLENGAIFVTPAPEPTYREKRKAAYIAELGQTPDFTETVGDVMDDLIREVRALSNDTPKTAEFKAIADKVDAIKTRFPKR